jgi:hypothetical protein
VSQQGMICTRCHEDTGCDPDFSHLSSKSVDELCAGWLCANCMDEDSEIQAFEATERAKADA